MKLEQELILAHVLEKDRTWIITRPDFSLTCKQKELYEQLIKRFENEEPLPYILGYKEFYGRNFIVNSSVLIPRPETELMVERAKQISKNNQKCVIADVGCGCGAIAISCALEIPEAKIFAVDISDLALCVAKQNAKILNAKVKFKQGNLLEPVKNIISAEKFLIILANLPYIPTLEYEKLDERIKKEPKLALDGGEDGLDLYKKLCEQIFCSLLKATVIFEIMPKQKKEIEKIIRAFFPNVKIQFHKDLASRVRIVEFQT